MTSACSPDATRGSRHRGRRRTSVLQLVHEPAYVAAVRGRRAAAPLPQVHDPFGLGSEDNPIFDGMHEASALVTGATRGRRHGGPHRRGAARRQPRRRAAPRDAGPGIRVLRLQRRRRRHRLAAGRRRAEGGLRRSGRPPRRRRGGGLLPRPPGADHQPARERLHGLPRHRLPASESGHGAAEGTAVNVALPPGTGDAGWLRAFHAVVPPLVRAFEPQILVTQLGCDTHRLDPLAQLDLSVDAHRHSYAALHQLAHEVTGGRWIAVGGGGYEIVQVVPRSWTHLLAEITGHPLDPDTETPDSWLELVRATHRTRGTEAPHRRHRTDLPPVGRRRGRPRRPGGPRDRRDPPRGVPRSRPRPHRSAMRSRTRPPAPPHFRSSHPQ